MIMIFISFAMVNLGCGALYECIITKDNNFIKNKSLNLLSWGIALNGFITALLFSVNPFLNIFIFFFLMLLNIFKFKKISQDITEEWNEHYDYLKKYYDSDIIEKEKKKFVIIMKYLQYGAIFSGGLIIFVQFLKLISSKIKLIKLPVITYYGKNLKKEKGFENNDEK